MRWHKYAACGCPVVWPGPMGDAGQGDLHRHWWRTLAPRHGPSSRPTPAEGAAEATEGCTVLFKWRAFACTPEKAVFALG